MDEIECAVCSHPQTTPCILPCCHNSVCNSHISEFCPVCNIPINPEEVIENWLLISLIKNPESFPCERCENGSSYYYCQECRIILCQSCYSEVHKGKYSLHNYSALSTCSYEEKVCKTHNLSIEYFCIEEWKGLCLGCFDMHEDHPVLNIHEAATQTLYEVKSKRIQLKKIQEQVKYEIEELEITKNEIQRKYNDMVEITKDTFSQLKRLLEFKESETLSCIDSVKEKKICDIDMIKVTLSKKCKRLANVMSMIDISNELPDSVMMESMKYLTSLIQGSIDSYESTLSTFNTTFPYPDFKILFQSFDKFSYNETEIQSSRSNNMTPMRYHKKSNATSSYSSRYSSPMHFRLSTPTMPFALPEDTLDQRKFVSKQQTSHSIKLSWNHCTSPVTYILEYGIGSKTSGVEQFRQVYHGPSYNCLITDLLPKTTYRFRVCPIDENDIKGDWSDIISVTTLDLQSLDESTFKNTGIVVKRGDEKWIQFERAGMIQAAYPFPFGKHTWEVKVLYNSFYSNEDSSGWLKIGVSSSKNKQIIGFVHNYSASKAAKINVFLDVDNSVIKFKSSENQEPEIFNLTEGPQIPSFQYKPSKNSRNNVKILVKFDEKPMI
jgi:B-box zinc finger